MFQFFTSIVNQVDLPTETNKIIAGCKIRNDLSILCYKYLIDLALYSTEMEKKAFIYPVFLVD